LEWKTDDNFLLLDIANDVSRFTLPTVVDSQLVLTSSEYKRNNARAGYFVSSRYASPLDWSTPQFLRALVKKSWR